MLLEYVQIYRVQRLEGKRRCVHTRAALTRGHWKIKANIWYINTHIFLLQLNVMLINARKQSLPSEYRAYSLSQPKMGKCNRTDNIGEGGQVKKCFKWIPLTFRKKKCVSSRGWNAISSFWELAHGLLTLLLLTN